jgi:hypothetical protein
MWTDQVVDDNQAVASAIAQATNERFSEQMRTVENEARRWRELMADRGTDEVEFAERIRREIKKTYDDHSGKLDGWHLTDAEGKMLAKTRQSSKSRPSTNNMAGEAGSTAKRTRRNCPGMSGRTFPPPRPGKR